MRTTIQKSRKKTAPVAVAQPAEATGFGVQARLVSALRDALSKGGGRHVFLIETHISYVLLTGQFAYKIKKAVELRFLDFRDLAARRFYCEEELRLNRRLAPNLYLDVVPITGSVDSPVLGGSGPVIEYAVKMREFSQEALASRALARGELSAAHVDALAAKVAAFHRKTCVASIGGPFGTPENVLRAAVKNFTQVRPLLDDDAAIAVLDVLAAWTEREHAVCAGLMALRRGQGFVRECHGDLHLNNIAFFEHELTIFDCIEFNEEMRWIDVMSEIAFVVMDLRDRGRPDLSHRFLNAYLEITGDYDGLRVLRFYLVYRSIVRAMVSALRAVQLKPGDGKTSALGECRSYLNIAKHYAQPPRPAIIITHGLAGSGKTTWSQSLLEVISAVRIRTDVERKRQCGLARGTRTHSDIDSDIYAPETTRETYLRVLELARSATTAGWKIIVDAAFLKRWQRRLFRDLASDLSVPFVIVTFVADETVLRDRILRRLRDQHDASDADLAVLEHQVETQEPLAPDEQRDTVSYETQTLPGKTHRAAPWRGVLERLAALAPEVAEKAISA
jgi:aminoglycoside phosphotransferase family enzyme/predicted kinase